MLYQDINYAKEEKKFILGIFLDFQAAYDSVYIDELIYKKAQAGNTGRCYVGFIAFFLAELLRWHGEVTSLLFGILVKVFPRGRC